MVQNTTQELGNHSQGIFRPVPPPGFLTTPSLSLVIILLAEILNDILAFLVFPVYYQGTIGPAPSLALQPHSVLRLGQTEMSSNSICHQVIPNVFEGDSERRC